MSFKGQGAVSSTVAKTPKGAIKAKGTSQTLVAENDSRVVLIVTNGSSADVDLACGPTAVKEEGLYLKAEGGSIAIPYYTGEVSVIARSGEGVVGFVEI